MKSLEYPKEKRLAFAKYAELCWASYSTGFNEGMYGDKEKKWGFNERGEYYTDDEISCHIFNAENNICQKLLYILYFILGILVIVSFNGCSFKHIDPQYYEFKRLCKKEAKGLVFK